MKMVLVSVGAAILLSSACGTATITSGKSLEGEFPVPDHSLENLWPNAEQNFLRAGYPVSGSWYADSYDLSGEGIIGIHASSADFTPVLAAVDPRGNILACSDSWKGGNDALIVLENIPDGSMLLVFSLDDRRGDYQVKALNASGEELSDFIAFSDANVGTVFGSLPQGRIYSEMENFLLMELGSTIYADDPQISRIHPYMVEDTGILTVELMSEDFDPMLVLVQNQEGNLAYIMDNDDYDGLNSRVDSWVDPGDYMIIALSYDNTGGSYILDVDFLPGDQLSFSTISAGESGMEYSGEIRAGENLAIALWRELAEGEYTDSYLDLSDPTSPFLLDVVQPARYTLNATSSMDICLTLLRITDSGCDFVAFNDDGPEMGTNSGISQILTAGEYLAVVSSYSDDEQGSVQFSFETESLDLPTLRSGVNSSAWIDFDEPEMFYSFDVEPGWSYTVSAENSDLDPMIEIYLPDGSALFDDDSGGDLNSLLTFEPSEEQSGTCYVKVSTYWGDSEGSITVRLDKYRVDQR